MNKFAKVILILIFVLLGVQVALGVIGLKQARVDEPVEEPVAEVVDEMVLDEVDTETNELIACIELNCLNIAE